MFLIRFLTPFLFLLSVLLAQTCENPMLKTVANPNGTIPALTTPTKITGLQFCKFLNDQNSCCSADTIDKISATLNATRDILLSQMKETDKNISESRKYLDVMAKNMRETTKIMKDLNKTQQEISAKVRKTRILQNFDVLANAMESLGKAGQGVPGLDDFAKRTKAIAPDSPTEDAADIMNKHANGFINMTKNQFKSFQASRKQCIDLLLKTYSKFYCLSCKSPSDLFVGQKMKLHPDLCIGLMTSCFEFLSLNELYSSLANLDFFKSQADLTTITKNYLQDMKGNLDKLSGVVDQMQTNPTAAIKGATEIANSISSSASAQALIEFAKNQQNKPKPKISRFPTTCLNSSSCTHICTKFINKRGIAIDTVVANPGVDLADTVSRVLNVMTNELVEEQRNNRILEVLASSADLDYDSTGLKLDSVTSGVEASVEVQADPAGVEASVTAEEGLSASFRRMIKVSMMMVMSVVGFIIIA